MTTAQKWRMLQAWLKRNFPPEFTVTMKSVPIKKLHGWTALPDGCGPRSFDIRINRKQCFDLRVETLIHEWAHVLTWFGAETHLDDHSAEWGIAYARIYRTFIEWNWGKESDEKG